MVPPGGGIFEGGVEEKGAGGGSVFKCDLIQKIKNNKQNHGSYYFLKYTFFVLFKNTDPCTCEKKMTIGRREALGVSYFGALHRKRLRTTVLKFSMSSKKKKNRLINKNVK